MNNTLRRDKQQERKYIIFRVRAYQGGEAGLASGRHENESGFLRRVFPDGCVGGFVHGGHARAVVLAGVTLRTAGEPTIIKMEVTTRR